MQDAAATLSRNKLLKIVSTSWLIFSEIGGLNTFLEFSNFVWRHSGGSW
jgi:hypothetical protein